MADTIKQIWNMNLVDSEMRSASAGFATTGELDDLAQIVANFGSYTTANGIGEDNHPDVEEPNKKTIYLVKDYSITSGDSYKEWICTDVETSAYDLIGDTLMDLSYYYTMDETSGSQEIADALDLKQNILTAGTDLVINDGIIGVNTNGIITNSSNKEFVAGDSTYAKGKGAIAVGYETSSIGYGSLAQGWHTLASADIDASVFIMYCVNSHAEGGDTSAMGNCAHAEGIMTFAGTCSHAEGHQTEAKNYSHSEGEYTHALGYYSHAEGRNTYTSAQYSHAEGYGTSAISNYSHAEGYDTIAGSESMHVGGTYNKTSSDALFVIGNGTAYNKRSDAFIVSANGTVSATKFIDAEPTLTITGGNYVSVAEQTNKLVIDLDSDLGNMFTSLSSILSAGAIPTTGRHILGVDNGTLTWLEVNQ